jgi:hypothetical protein
MARFILAESASGEQLDQSCRGGSIACPEVGLTAGDYNWSFNLEKSSAATRPLGVQVGKDFSIGKQPIIASVAEGAAVRSGNTPNSGWILGFELTPIFE